MGFGLALVFYFVHTRVWAVPVRDAQGRLMLWVGGTANKNKDVFEQSFRQLTHQIAAELKLSAKTKARIKTSADAPLCNARRKIIRHWRSAPMARTQL